MEAHALDHEIISAIRPFFLCFFIGVKVRIYDAGILKQTVSHDIDDIIAFRATFTVVITGFTQFTDGLSNQSIHFHLGHGIRRKRFTVGDGQCLHIRKTYKQAG